MPDYDFRTALSSHRVGTGYDMSSLDQVWGYGAQLALHGGAAVQANAEASNGFVVNTRSVEASIEVPVLAIDSANDLAYATIGFRVYVPAVTGQWMCFLNLGSPDGITGSGDDEGFYFFYYPEDQPGLGADGEPFGFRLRTRSLMGGTDFRLVAMSASPTLTPGWHDIALQMRLSPTGTDAFIWFDGQVFNFDVVTGGLSDWFSGSDLRPGYLGINPNGTYWTPQADTIYFDTCWVSGEAQYLKEWSYGYSTASIQRINAAQHIAQNTPPTPAPTPYIFDVERSGPITGGAATQPADDEILLTGTYRRWVTGVVKQAIPKSGGKYTCAFEVTNTAGWDSAAWVDMKENIIAGVVGDEAFAFLPDEYSGTFGPYVGAQVPGFGLLLDNEGRQTFRYLWDFTEPDSGVEVPTPQGSGQIIMEVVFDTDTNVVEVFLKAGCSVLTSAAYVVNLGDHFGRFAVSIRYPIGIPTFPGIKVITDAASCDPEAILPGAEQRQGVYMRLPDGVSCSGAQQWLDLLAAANHIYNDSYTGLGADNTQSAIEALAGLINMHSGNANNPHDVVHAQLSDKGANTHAEIDTELARLETDKLDIADALEAFSFAAYGALGAPGNAGFPNLGGGFQKIDVLTAGSGVAPRNVVIDDTNSSFAFIYDGVYRVSISGSMEHNSSNGGRIFTVRVYDETAAAYIGGGVVMGTGRNAEATTISAGTLLPVTEAQKGHVLVLHIGGGDSYTAVSFQSLSVNMNAVSEWQEPLGG